MKIKRLMNEDWGRGSDGNRKVSLGRGTREGRTGAQNRMGSSGHWRNSPGRFLAVFPPGVCCSLGFAQLPHLLLGFLVLGPMKS